MYTTKTILCNIFPNATTCPHRLRGPPSWLWPKCNRLLTVGAHRGRFRCPDDVRDMYNRGVPGGPYTSMLQVNQTIVVMGISPTRKNSHGRTWNGTRDLAVSSQKFWPQRHEAGRHTILFMCLTIQLVWSQHKRHTCPQHLTALQDRSTHHHFDLRQAYSLLQR
jgi:hypothetical protein